MGDDGHGEREDCADQEDQSELGDSSDDESADGSRPRLGGRGGQELTRLPSRRRPRGRAHACQNPSAKLRREDENKLRRERLVDC
jgi:hypothetical protein